MTITTDMEADHTGTEGIPHQWVQEGGGYGVGDATGGQSSVGWMERCEVCLDHRYMVKSPSRAPYENAWVKTNPACSGPADEHVVRMVQWQRGDITEAAAFDCPPLPMCLATNSQGRRCLGDMSYRQGMEYCADHDNT